MFKVASLVIFCSLLPLIMCKMQRVIVKGTLMCDGKPFKGATVKLIDKDPGFDDTLGEMKTGADGTFSIDGKQDEMTNLDVQLKIYHNCDDGWKPCERRWMFEIPSQYLNDASAANPKVMNAGVFNLNVRQDDEERDCIH